MASNKSAFTNFTSDKHPRLKVLYSYDYIDDDDSMIWMKQDEIFYLLNDDRDDWWQVCRPDSPDNMFFVPSTYVQVLTNTSVNSVNDLSSLNTEFENVDTGEKGIIDVKPICVNTEISHSQMDTNENDQPKYINWIGCTDTNHISFIKVHVATQPVNQSDNALIAGGEYVELENFRKNANLPPLDQDCSKACPEQNDGSSPTKSLSSDSYSKSEKIQAVESNISLAIRRTGNSTQVSDRLAKSRSVMIDHCAQQFPGPPPPKSATSPQHFTIPKVKVPSVVDDGLSEPSGQVLNQVNLHGQKSLQSVNLNEPIEGSLKCKFSNGKKSVKKWTVLYVKLFGSNLLFYKDQKSSMPRSDAPHGKVDHMLSLVTCSIDKYKQDQGSKRNQILIITKEGQIVLKADDEAKMKEWFLKLHTKIKELGGQPDPSPTLHTSASTPSLSTPEPDMKPAVKGKHSRKPSDGSKGKIKDVLNKFIINRSDKEKLRQRGIYRDAIFGADLKQLCIKEKSKVPLFVQRSIEAIEKRGLDTEGIYRIGGNVSQIQKLRCIVDQGVNYNLDNPTWDFNVLTGTLKLFFRELKDPLFTYALFDKFHTSYLLDKYEDRLKAIKDTIGELPESNRETVKLMFKHLTNVIEKHSENKMASHQLAIVFGPTLIWPEVTSQNLATSMMCQSRIVEFILTEFKNIFG